MTDPADLTAQEEAEPGRAPPRGSEARDRWLPNASWPSYVRPMTDEATRGELVIVPVFRLASRGRIWAVAMAWLQSRGKVAREREDRLTAESIMRDMPPGGVWLDRDGDRIRIIVQPATSDFSPSSGLEQVEVLLRLGQHGHAPRGGTNDPASVR